MMSTILMNIAAPHEENTPLLINIPEKVVFRGE